jgi:hypothetical protein
MSPCAQRPFGAARAICGAPVGASRGLMPSRRWKRASPIHGDHAIALRGSFSLTPSRTSKLIPGDRRDFYLE